MKKLRLLTIVFSVISISLQAQRLNDGKSGSSAKCVFAEIGGPGLASINYDMRLGKKEDGIGFRVGAGGLKIDQASIVFVPVGLNYLLGKDGKNYFELGGGATFVSAGASRNDDSFKSTFAHLNLGYRLQPKAGGFLFRASINPIIGKKFFIPYYGGISFGYKF